MPALRGCVEPADGSPDSSNRCTAARQRVYDDDLFEIDSASIRALLDAHVAARLQSEANVADTDACARLRRRRESAGLTQVELAERTGIDQAVISRLERGKHRPRLDTLQRLASALGLSVSALLATP